MSAGMADESLMAMAYQDDPYKDTGKLFVEFRMQAQKNDEMSIAAGRPMFEDREYIRILVPGDKDNIVDRETWAMDYRRFPKQYEAFKRGQKEEVVGTPLSVLALMTPPIVSASQVEEFKFFHVRTAEQLVGMSDAVAQKFMGYQDIKKKVQAFLETAKAAAPQAQLRAELEERDSKIQTLERALKEMGDRIDGMAKGKKNG